MRPKTYQEAGVSIEAGDRFARFIANHPSPAVSRSIGGFAGGFRLDPTTCPDPVVFSTTDGVGTKLLVARALGKFDTIGIDLVAMCVNDLIVNGAKPVQFLDYIAIGHIDADLLETLIQGVIRGCELAECQLAGGETAEMPDVYGPTDFDLAGFAVGVASASQVRPRKEAIRPGDLLLGLPSSGIHSNGLSLARKVLPIESGLWPELLTPTRIYVRDLVPLFPLDAFKAAAHITGGGLVGNLQRVLPDGLRIELSRDWPRPSIFDAILAAGVSPDEMERVFNMGIGMVLVVDSVGADTVRSRLQEQGTVWHEIGRLT